MIGTGKLLWVYTLKIQLINLFKILYIYKQQNDNIYEKCIWVLAESEDYIAK